MISGDALICFGVPQMVGEPLGVVWAKPT